MRDLHAPQGLAKFHQELPLMKLLFGYQWNDVGHVSRRPEWLNLYKLQSCYESSGRTGRNANCAVAPLAHCKLQACRTQLGTSQRRPRAKDPPPGGFSGKRPSGFVAPRSQTAAGMLPRCASPSGLLPENRPLANFKTGSE